MEKNYKAIQYKITTHHEAVVDKDEPWNNTPAWSRGYFVSTVGHISEATVIKYIEEQKNDK